MGRGTTLRGEVNQLTEDQLKLLFVLYLTTKPPISPEGEVSVEKWAKEIFLLAMAYDGAVRGLFTYDYAPMVKLIGGAYRFVNVSQECLHDLRSLASMGLIEILSLATDRHLFIRAYRISEQGRELVKELLEDENARALFEEAKSLVCCKHGEVMDAYLSEENGAPKIVLRCTRNCVREIKGLFETEDISYESEPVLF